MSEYTYVLDDEEAQYVAQIVALCNAYPDSPVPAEVSAQVAAIIDAKEAKQILKQQKVKEDKDKLN